MKKEEEKKYYAIYEKDENRFVLNTDFKIEQIVPNIDITVFIGSKEKHEEIFEKLKEIYPNLKDYEIRYMEVEKWKKIS